MDTPICDFLAEYRQKNTVRMHMPGHKGTNILGCEDIDITEITGADSLYSADGIIAKSEANASAIFGCPTYYSTEGSTQCIKAMLYLAVQEAIKCGKKPYIYAFRNCHKAFLDAAILLDFEVEWLYEQNADSYLCCNITPDQLRRHFTDAEQLPTAVYVTSPDYLGHILDIKGLSAVCREFNVLLLVDNAHGAYLNFLENNMHPIHLGADICCDSAHKTLPTLTGGAYLHIAKDSPLLEYDIKAALGLFGSTSPSYLILSSLDKVNCYLANEYRDSLKGTLEIIRKAKEKLRELGFSVLGDEPLKITINTAKFGYSGKEIAKQLESHNIYCEFSDDEYLVLMPSEKNTRADFEALIGALSLIKKESPLSKVPPELRVPKRALSIRNAAFMPSKRLEVRECEGKILSRADIHCPPAVAIVVGGEVIERAQIDALLYYGITSCEVII